MKINDIVREMIETHTGGEKFFDELDDTIRKSENLIRDMMNKVGNYCYANGVQHIIVSGSFGKVFSTYYSAHRKSHWNIDVIVVSGGLRSGNSVEDFGELISNSGGSYIFVDDSFYLGRTRDKIKDKIESYGGNMIKTFVFYDGSNFVDESVDSMYRYYDNN